MTVIHPGSIQARVGACLALIETNVEQQDMFGLWNFVQLLETYVSPYFNNNPDAKLELAALPSPSSVGEAEAFHNMMARVRICLQVLHKENLYGYHQAPMAGNRGLYEEATP